MNDENDKPKDDDWGMTMPHLNLKKDKNEDDFSEEFAPQQNTPGDDWSMTTPNINLGQNQSPTDYSQTVPNLNVPQEDWEMNAPKPQTSAPQTSANQPPDDWSMTTPNVNLPQNALSDFDKTTPNVNIPAELLEEQTPKPDASANQPGGDDWMMSMPQIPTSREEKREGWQMPQPVFRISSGTTSVPESPQNQSERSPSNIGGQSDFANQTTPYINLSDTQNENIRETAPTAEAQAEATIPAAKKRSKLPFIIAGLFMFFFFGIVTLGAVYFLFLNGNEAAKVANIEKTDQPSNKIEPVSANTTSSSSTTTTTDIKLPKEIDYNGKMMLVSAGSFTMGSDSGEDISKPAHDVTLPAFYIDKTEVTNAQYKEFCDATNRPTPTPQYWNKDYFTARPDAPVVGVSFEDAKAYAAWAGKRLPTEEEWEKAASWDETKKVKYEFPWGNTFANANAAFGIPELADVGKYPSGASPSGVLDMAGNAAEWVEAYFKPYQNSKAADPNFGDTNRVVRGGVFNSNTGEKLKTTKRIWIPPDFQPNDERASYIGFRCAISADDSRLKDILSK